MLFDPLYLSAAAEGNSGDCLEDYVLFFRLDNTLASLSAQ
jgi:hypothetical protein